MAKNKSRHSFSPEQSSKHHTDSPEEDEHYISKSQAKRDVEAMQKLGEKLVKLSPNELDKFDLEERLKDAVLFAQTIRSHSAHRRQMQLIGKLMRQTDTESIQTQYERYHNQLSEQTAQFHQIETWRDRLIKEGDTTINELLAEYPQLERSRLRQLLRNIHKETEQNKPPKSARQLFKYLKEVMLESD